MSSRLGHLELRTHLKLLEKEKLAFKNIFRLQNEIIQHNEERGFIMNRI